MRLLRGAEECAVRNGESNMSRYRRLLSLYRAVKDRESADISGRLPPKGAAPRPFALLRYLGMPPHNNGAGPEMRDTTALHRSVLHQLSAAEGREVFSARVSAARIRRKPGMFPRTAVESLTGDLDRGPFKPPPGRSAEGRSRWSPRRADAGLTAQTIVTMLNMPALGTRVHTPDYREAFFRGSPPPEEMETGKPTAIELFCGCGGMGLGLEQAGFEILYANDISKDATSTYEKNLHAGIVECKDISQISPRNVRKRIGRSVDIVVAGTPCQGFSTLGKRDPDDPRNALFKHLVRFLEEFRPKMFVMENVSGMLSMRDGQNFEEIRKKLEKTGYNTTCMKLSAAAYGVPQNRERVFIIGTTGDKGDIKIPRPSKRKTTIKDAISDLDFLDFGEESPTYAKPPDTKYQRAMRRGCRVLHNHKASNHSRKVRDRFAMIPVGEDGNQVMETGKRDCFKMNPDSQSRTVTTLPEDFVHYKKDRIPTVREMARLQSFPDWFVFMGPRTTGGDRRALTCCQYTQVGNAVPPMLARKLFKSIIPMLARGA